MHFLSRSKPAPPGKGSKQNSLQKSHHLNKKILVIGIVVISLLLLLTRGYFLSSQDNPISSAKMGLLSQFTGSKQPENLQSTSDKQTMGGGTDVFFGPVRLKNSGYVTDKLNDYVQETGSAAGTQEQPAATQDIGTTPQFSLQDIILHPLTVISSLSSSYTSEYMNNSRKTTLVKLVDAVSRYYVSYNKFPSPEHPKADQKYAWIEEMVDKNEMSGVYSYILETTSPVSYCGSVEQTGYCYNTDGKDAIIYTLLDVPDGVTICEEGGLFFLWSSSDNKLGEVCLDTEPTQLSNFTYLNLRY